MKQILAIVFCIAWVHQGLGQSDFSQVNAYFGETADRLKLHTFQLDFNKNKKDFYWPYQDKNEDSELGFTLKRLESSIQGLEFSVLDFYVSGGWMLAEDHWLKAQVGVSHLETVNSGPSQDLMIGTLEYAFQWRNNSFSGVRLGQNYMAPVVIPLAGLARNMYSRHINPFTFWNLDEHWQVNVQTRFDFSDDHNQRFWLDGQVMYAFSKFPHWIRLGFGTTYLGYQTPSFQYWSPRRFSSYGPRADVSFQIFDQLSYFVGGSYNFFQENSFTPGDGYYLRTGMNWGNRNSKLISLSFENGESTQNGRLWYSHFYNLSASFFW